MRWVSPPESLEVSMKHELLPIGSVVTMQGAKRKVMIIGTGVRNTETNENYDYVAVPYPVGYLGPEAMFLCNHADIETLNFIGFVNSEFQAFRAEVKEG